jgi:hypothetical protein
MDPAQFAAVVVTAGPPKLRPERAMPLLPTMSAAKALMGAFKENHSLGVLVTFRRS